MIIPRRSFTLVELFIVMVIMSILVAIMLPALSHVKKVALETKCKSNIKQLALLASAKLSSIGRLPKPCFDYPIDNPPMYADLDIGYPQSSTIWKCPAFVNKSQEFYSDYFYYPYLYWLSLGKDMKKVTAFYETNRRIPLFQEVPSPHYGKGWLSRLDGSVIYKNQDWASWPE